MQLEVELLDGLHPGVRESREGFLKEKEMKLIGAVVVFLSFFLVLVSVSAGAGAATTTSEINNLPQLAQLEKKLREIGSRAEVSLLILIFNESIPDLVRPKTKMRLTTWEVRAAIDGRSFEILDFNILVVDDEDWKENTTKRLALEIAKRAQVVSRGGK